ncbi:MAG: hypothetical protein QGG58_10535, partial [Chloroflexota bacterium]|nr:hypothetical protein [Chloroflexota bacterium]
MTALADAALHDQVMHVNTGLPESGLYGAAKPVGDGSRVPWRLSPEPITVSPAQAAALESLLLGQAPKKLPPLDLSCGTDFQQSVWRQLLKIPLGQTGSY